MTIQINNSNRIIVKELKKVLEDLKGACNYTSEDCDITNIRINTAIGRIETIISMLDIEE